MLTNKWLYIIGAIVFLILFIIYEIKFKHMNLGCVSMFNGEIKGGKSLISCYQAIRKHKVNHLKWFVATKIFRKKGIEEPLLYSNMPLDYKYFVPLTKELMLRITRFNYKSVILVDEASLFADSMSYSNDEYNEKMLMFNKLIGHELHGGFLIYNTQAIDDCHYSIKRCLNRYYMIMGGIKWVPFIHILKLKTMLYSSDKSTLNVNNVDRENDIDYTYKYVIVPKKYYKMYDRFYLSKLSDNLPLSNKINFIDDNGNKSEGLKATEIISIKSELKKKK